MDNLTHTLVGLVAAKAGLGRVSPYATTVCVLAANAPDADLVALAGGRWFYLQHHRGITHSVVGVLALALLLPLAFYLFDRLVARRVGRPLSVRLGPLAAASLVAGATHPLLDWTNSYGVQPFLPWSGAWYYGDLVFIVDPWLWLLLGGAVFLLTATTRARMLLWAGACALFLALAFGIIPARGAAEIPAASKLLWLAFIAALAAARFAGVGTSRARKTIPAAALSLVVAYWGVLAVFHARALARAGAAADVLTERDGEPKRRLAAMPTLADPTRWRVVADGERASYLLDLKLTEETRETTGGARRYEKLRGGEAARVVRLAESDYGARVFLDFARFPLARVTVEPPGEARARLVDLRFAEPDAASSGGTFAAAFPLPDGK